LVESSQSGSPQLSADSTLNLLVEGVAMAAASFPRLFCRETSEVHQLQRMATRFSVPPGKEIFQEGERADFAFGLSEGVVRLFKMLPNGRRQIVSLVLPGEFLEMPSVDKHMLSATAVDEVLLHRFPREPLEAYILSNPNMMRLMAEFAARQLMLAQEHLLMVCYRSAEERVVFFLLAWNHRLAALNQVLDYLPLPMKREDIADFLAIKLETVSRALKRLERKKLIRIAPKGVVLAATLLSHREAPARRGGPRQTGQSTK
jgi:CRP/FNR family transcriptional regulator, anaerobic regulatory protein